MSTIVIAKILLFGGLTALIAGGAVWVGGWTPFAWVSPAGRRRLARAGLVVLAGLVLVVGIVQVFQPGALRGPVGPKGPPGLSGKDADPAAIAADVETRLDLDKYATKEDLAVAIGEAKGELRASIVVTKEVPVEAPTIVKKIVSAVEAGTPVDCTQWPPAEAFTSIVSSWPFQAGVDKPPLMHVGWRVGWGTLTIDGEVVERQGFSDNGEWQEAAIELLPHGQHHITLTEGREGPWEAYLYVDKAGKLALAECAEPSPPSPPRQACEQWPTADVFGPAIHYWPFQAGVDAKNAPFMYVGWRIGWGTLTIDGKMIEQEKFSRDGQWRESWVGRLPHGQHRVKLSGGPDGGRWTAYLYVDVKGDLALLECVD